VHAPASKILFKEQRRAIRIIKGIPFRQDCREAFRELNILTLPSLFILECLKMSHQNQHDLKRNCDIHSYGTRNREDLVIQHQRLSSTKYSFNYWSAKIFNKMPKNIRQLSHTKFKDTMKSYLIGRAFYSVQEFLDSEIPSVL